MTTITTGIFFVGKDHPSRPAVTEHRNDAGEYVLKMRLIDNQGRGRVEGYLVRWVGSQAQAWRNAHPALKAGDILRLELENPRSLLGSTGMPETQATVRTCELLAARSPSDAQAA